LSRRFQLFDVSLHIMHLAQNTISSSYSLSDILGGFQVILLALAVLYSLVLSVIAIKRVNYKLLIFPPILSASITLWIIGRLFFDRGMFEYLLGMEDTSMDPSSSMMDSGVMHASIGASLLVLSVVGVMVFLSFLIINLRTNKG
jgi:uncharacterized membrane protein HdeD (DUF308 family)